MSESHLINIFFIVLVGLCLGSFLTVIYSRLPNNKRGLLFGRSKCQSCKKTLKILDLFPLFSWVISLGKCRYCGKKVSSIYPAIEITTALVILIIFLINGFDFKFFIFSAISLCLIAIVFIDLKHKIIPDEIQIALLFLALVLKIHEGDEIFFMIVAPISAFLFGLTLRWVFFLWKRRESLGMGDVKFLAPAGLLVGFDGIIPFMFYAGIIGVASGVAWKFIKKEDDFPFGPALCISLFICLVFPGTIDSFWNLYGILGI